MQNQRELVSAELSIAPYGTKISVYDLNIRLNRCLKFRVTQCTCKKDIKTFVDLRDIPPDQPANSLWN